MKVKYSTISLPRKHSTTFLSVELVEEIIRFVALLADSKVACLALLQLALSCHWLSFIALSKLWGRFQHSLLPLINILGTGNFVSYMGVGVRRIVLTALWSID